jgi:hypothetical protein
LTTPPVAAALLDWAEAVFVDVEVDVDVPIVVPVMPEDAAARQR